MESDCQRLDQSALQSADIVRQLEAEICLMGNVFLEHTVNRRSCKEYHVRAEIILAFLAEFTLSAGFSRLQCHTVTNLQMLNILTDFHYNSARLMAQYERRFYHVIPDCPCLIIVQVRTADSHIIQLYQNLVVLWLGDGSFFKIHLLDIRHYCYFHHAFHLLFSSSYECTLCDFIISQKRIYHK